MQIIESIHNPKVSYWSQLKLKKGREQQGLHLIEGVKLLEEAILSNQEIESVIINKERSIPSAILKMIKENNIKQFTVSDVIFNKLTETETPQGILAVVKIKYWKFDDLLDDTNFLLLLDEIQDPGNLGTIIRSADAAGISGIVLGTNTVELYNPKVIRSAMGSVFHIPVYTGELGEVIERLRALKIKIVGTSPYAEKDLYYTNMIKNTAVLIGNEARGLSVESQNSVDQIIKIPICGKAESLNAAMATTIILFEHVRQKKFYLNN